MSELKQFATCITCHAWNADRSKIAFCPNNNEIHVYGKKGNEFTLEDVLTEHDSVVVSIDWAPKTNRIVSSSQDRNAYVWTWQDAQKTWKPTLVILRIPKAATQVKWSPKENKFALGSAAKIVAVCYFDIEHDWWVAKHIKKHKSTVLSVAWHPNNVLLATGSSDMKARVFSGFIKGIDEKPGETPFGSKLPTGEMFGEYALGSWVHSVNWSASGNKLVCVSHDSSITIVDVTKGAPGEVTTLRIAFLPLQDALFVNENQILGGGHDASPLLFSCTNGTWAFTERLEAKAQKGVDQKQDAFALFKNKVEVGADTNVKKLNTLHQNCITCMLPFSGTPEKVTEVTTTALDGKLVLWKL